jgi:hypothetical protein
MLQLTRAGDRLPSANRNIVQTSNQCRLHTLNCPSYQVGNRNSVLTASVISVCWRQKSLIVRLAVNDLSYTPARAVNRFRVFCTTNPSAATSPGHGGRPRRRRQINDASQLADETSKADTATQWPVAPPGQAPIRTAYRLTKALACAAIALCDPAPAGHATSGMPVPDAPKILLANVYGWVRSGSARRVRANGQSRQKRWCAGLNEKNFCVPSLSNSSLPPAA